MAKLPLHLITEILLCLPAKSLLRFRCVSQSLCLIIDGTDFIDSHLTRSSQNINHHKMVFLYKSPQLRSEVSRFDVCDINGNLEADILLEKPLSSYLWREVYGYCNGLFLLCRGLSKLALWNPSTRKYRYLLDCPFKVPHNVDIYGLVGLGLCYDSIDGYKVVLILFIEVDEPIDTAIQVWVLTVRSNIWRRLQDFPYLEYEFKFPGPGFGYFVDGALHWLCNTPAENNEIIVVFDVRNETFSIVPLPHPDYPVHQNIADLHILEGCLCISFYSCSIPHRADLYVRRKDEVGVFTWRKVYSATEPFVFHIDCFKSVRVLGYSKSRYKILLDVGLEQLVSYDIEEQRFVKNEIEKDGNWYDPIVFVESLVKIGGGV